MTAPRTPSRAPRALVVLSLIGGTLFVLPLLGLLTETPWSRLGSILSDDIVVDALILSAVTSIAAAVLSALFGVPIAWVLSRLQFRGRAIARAIVTLPMVLPPVVGGAALLFALGRNGLIGGFLNDVTGFSPFSVWGVILANTFVAMPFLILTVEGALNGIDRRHEAAAQTLGATDLEVFRRITLPMIAPSLKAGLLLAWARSLGEFGATITFAGNLQGRTQTLPLAVFVNLQSADREPALAISLILVAISLTVLVSLRDRWWGAR